MLTDVEKDTLFNSLKIQVDVLDLGDNTFEYDIGENLKLLEANQVHEKDRDSVSVHWQTQDEPRENVVGRIMRELLAETIDATLTVDEPEEDFETVKGTRVVRIDFQTANHFITKVELFTNRLGSTTSGLIIAVYQKDTQKELVKKFIHNASIKDMSFTSITMESKLVLPGIDYYILVAEWKTGDTQDGIQIYRKYTGDSLLKFYNGMPSYLKGVRETTNVVIQISVNNKLAAGEPVSTDDINGKQASQKISSALRELVYSTWNGLVTRVDLIEVTGVQDLSAEQSGEFLYVYQFEATLGYETTWIEPSYVLKLVEVTLKLV